MMMKTTMKSGFAAMLLMATSIMPAFGSNASWRQDVEVPGDHFSLEGALELFKKSKSPEEFERLLNTPETKVNNLDLNEDGDIDYIKVIDRHDANVHAFIIRAVVSASELQDIAVIELEIHGNGKATLQIVGDEDIYGIETIIEPTEEVRINAGASTVRSYSNVWSWMIVQWVYDPYYVSWESPWGWYNRPYWWSPWRPVSYVVYRPYWDPYRPYYSVCHTHRVVYAREFYRPVRRTSVFVQERYRSDITYARQTRGRDNHYYDTRENDGRGKERYNRKSSQTRSLNDVAPSSTGRNSDSNSSGRTRSIQSESSSDQQTDTRTAPGTRTYQQSSETRVRTSRSDDGNRSSYERPQTQTRERTQTQSYERPQTQTRSASPQSVSPPRQSYSPPPAAQPRQESSSPAPSVERSRPSVGATPAGGSPAAPKKRGRDNR